MLVKDVPWEVAEQTKENRFSESSFGMEILHPGPGCGLGRREGGSCCQKRPGQGTGRPGAEWVIFLSAETAQGYSSP